MLENELENDLVMVKKKKGVDFIIVGAMKAGTTSLARHLGKHPDIHMPQKELHFFCKEDKYEKGIDYYYELLEVADNAGKIIGEKTPTYCYHEESPERIAGHFPDVKLIWIFRNPIERAYSHYCYFVQIGMERRAFSKVVYEHEKIKTEGIGATFVPRGFYVEQVERYLKYFPRENMLFLDFNALKTKPGFVINKCYDFLGLKEKEESDYADKKVFNKTSFPRSVQVQYFAYKLLRNNGLMLPYRAVSKINRSKKQQYPAMDGEVRKYLKKIYQPYNRKLSDLTGIDTEKWD